ncbi:VWA domain-containing protein [Phragmitibacter flavus]|uniref:VWA domain-containing protein n=1 Tax=Phragmitibacter flavus TaxID=2576071 RepID=A0A5R8K9S3_9BACT|nr:VWA domain-containing protein [Phragmitibacter flavus]TLD69058.1 VWA domain-containing protein [Phragmitibacter flavus]
MSFLNAILLAGAAAFTIPLLIHLLNRRRIHTVQWGAMHLLEKALKLRRRNLQLEQKLLLATRIAIPIFLALCLARPVFSLLRQFPGMDKRSLVVLLDDSASMRAAGEGGSTRDKATAELRRIIDQLPRGSDVSVILAGSPPRLLLDGPTTSHDLIFEKLNTTPSLAGPVAIAESLQLATTELKRTQTPARELLILSDFQQTDWQTVLDGGSLPELDPIKKIEPAPALTLYRSNSQLSENLALTHVDPSAFIIARDQPLALRARIQNHGQRDYQDIPVHLEADGVRIRSTRVTIAPQAEATFTLTHTFDTPGDHALTLRLEGDAFPEDNAFSLVIPVREEVKTLLISGRSGSAPMTGPADFLQIALSPHMSAATGLKDVILPTLVEEQKFRDRDLENQRVIIMANVEKLHGNQLKELQEHIKKGNSLIIFPGPNIDPRWYENDLYQKGTGLLPAKPAGFGHIDPNQMPARLLSQRHTHPATAYFNDARGMNLQDAAFTHWQKFDNIEGDTRILLNLDRGDPLLIEKPYGKGRVLLFTTTANAQWSTLPLQPAFVPLMQRLITHLATQNTPPQYQRTGNQLQLDLTEDQAKQPLQLIDPHHQAHDLKPVKNSGNENENQPAITYKDTFLPGLYELRPAKTTDTTPIRRFAFNPDPAESNLATLSSDQTRQIAERLGASFASDYDTFEKIDHSRRFGSEIWQPILLLVLFFLFAEVFLQQRIARA